MGLSSKRYRNWLINYELLVEYHKKYGNINVPRDYVINGVKLGVWLNNQRNVSKSKLTQEQISLLTKLGMKWDLRKTRLNDYHKLLRKYYKEHGNIDVPIYYEKNDIQLGAWLNHMRQAYRGDEGYKITQEDKWFWNEMGFKKRKLG